MNCDRFGDLIGMRCNPAGDAVEVITPFTFADGNGIELFAQERGSQVHFFDDGFTLLHLQSAGVQIGNNKNRWKPLRTIAQRYEVTLSDDGVFETLCSSEHASVGFARMVSTLLGVAAWERENAGVSLDNSYLVEEVGFYLRAWKPSRDLQRKPIVRGFSGRTLTFDYELDGHLIDAVQPHGRTTGAELRKLVDFNSSPVRLQREPLVIVDDRANPDAAKQELDILGRVATSWALTALIAASGATRLPQ